MSYYAVHKGKNIGIYANWDECKKNTIGYSGSIFKKFNNKEDAEYFLEHGKIPTKNLINKNLINKNINKIEKSDKNKKNLSNNEINIYTDGSLIKLNNNSYIGYGIYIPILDIKISKSLENEKTHNRAELLAIIDAINMIDENISIILNIYTDSLYSYRIFNDTGIKYKNNNYKDKEGNDVKNKDLVMEVINLKNKYNINSTHIKAHTKFIDEHHLGNKEADKLAYEGAKKLIHKDNNKK